MMLYILYLSAVYAAPPQYYPRQLDCTPFQPPVCTNTFIVGSDSKINYTAPYQASDDPFQLQMMLRSCLTCQSLQPPCGAAHQRSVVAWSSAVCLLCRLFVRNVTKYSLICHGAAGDVQQLHVYGAGCGHH